MPRICEDCDTRPATTRFGQMDLCAQCLKDQHDALGMSAEFHPCEHADCTSVVHFDDEPFCFNHSPDSGSFLPGYSYKANHPSTEGA